MTLRAKAFIAVVIICGMAAFAAGFLPSSWPAPSRFICYLLVAALASGFKVALPGINGTMSVNLVVILISVVELSPSETLLVGCVAALVQTWWHKHQIVPVHFAFNAAQIAIAIQLCYFVFDYSAAWLGRQVPLRLMITAIVYFLGNTLPVAAIVGLTEHRLFHKTWSECYFWSFPNYLVGAAVAWIITLSNARLGSQASRQMVPVIYQMYRSYRRYQWKLEQETNHVTQLESFAPAHHRSPGHR